MYRVDAEINWDLIGSIMTHDVIKHFSLGGQIDLFPDFTRVRFAVLLLTLDFFSTKETLI